MALDFLREVCLDSRSTINPQYNGLIGRIVQVSIISMLKKMAIKCIPNIVMCPQFSYIAINSENNWIKSTIYTQ